MRLIHLANFNSTNIGNGALINGLESTLEEDFSAPIQWQREAWDDYTFRLKDFDGAFIDNVNASDGLLVGGAVTFNGRDYNNHTGTRFELPFELWDSLKKPVVFYGLSYRHWPNQPYHHADKLKTTIEKILASKRMVLSVRNDGTREWITAMTGIKSEAILEVPDSAVFVRAIAGDYPEIARDKRNVIIAFNEEDAAYRYRDDHARARVVEALAGTVEKLSQRHPLRIILCPHYFDDFKMLSEFVARIKPQLAHQHTVTTGLCRIDETGRFYGRYQQADLAISMRVHSMSPCIGLGVPMVPFTTQERMTDFLARIGLADQAVDAFAPNAADALYEKAVYTLEHGAEVRAQFSLARDTMRAEARAFHHQIETFLQS
jgi:polysaccharide pyruvyl transferase WcaK-like protein